MGAGNVIEVRSLTKHYHRGAVTVEALAGVSLSIERGETVAIVGPSGSGKSTLLHLLGGLDEPTRGSVSVDGVELGTLSDDDLAAFRRRRLGFVFQFFNLLPTMTAWENVAVPRLLDGVPLRAERDRAVALLESVGLGHRVDHRPAELSGGQLQRVAIARSLIADPVLVLADEPTGNLDSAAGGEVLDLLRAQVAGADRTLVIVTHDPKIAASADRVIELVDGHVAGTPAAALG